MTESGSDPGPARLVFRRLTADYWVANEDGTPDERLGDPVYVVRTTPALLRDSPAVPWRSESPDGYIMASGVTFEAAKGDCEADTAEFCERCGERHGPDRCLWDVEG